MQPLCVLSICFLLLIPKSYWPRSASTSWSRDITWWTASRPTRSERPHSKLAAFESEISYRAFRIAFDSEPGRWLTAAMTHVYGEAPIRIRTAGGSIPISPFVATLGVTAVGVEEHRDLLAADMLLILDGPPHISGRSTLKFGARGISTVTLTVFGPRVPVHRRPERQPGQQSA